MGKVKEESEYLVKLHKPIQGADGEEIRQIDLSGIEGLNARDMERAEKLAVAEGGIVTVPELNTTYLLSLAASAIGQPFDVLQELGIQDATAVKRAVQSFLNGAG